MSVRVAAATAALLVLATATAGSAQAAQAAPAAPAVGPVVVAGHGAGDLVRATGSGFRAGATVQVTMAGGSVAVTLASTTAAADGSVALPDGTRIPTASPPGRYQLTMTQTDGTTASSSFGVVGPAAYFADALVPGLPADLGQAPFVIHLYGLAATSDVIRTVAVDGVTVPSHWYADDRAFDSPDIAFGPPAGLTVGPHQVTFTQTGPTPYSETSTAYVLPPRIEINAPVQATGDLAPYFYGAGWDDDFDATVVGAAGDRFTGEYRVARTTFGSYQVSGAVHVDHLSAGVATMTVVSRRNGATASTSFTVVPADLTAPGGLAPGQRLVQGGNHWDTYLVMQGDGNLVLYAPGIGAWWSSRTNGHPGSRLAVQADGNVVIYSPAGTPLWATNTNGLGPGVRFGIEDPTVGGGDLGVWTSTGRRAWSTFAFRGDNGGPPTLSAGQYLFEGQWLQQDVPRGPGRMYFTMQTDGNLVARTNYRGAVWATHTDHHPNAYVVLQTDGQLVVRGPDDKPLWTNGMHAAGARLVAQSDGNVVEYSAAGKAVWATDTVQR